MYGTTLSSRGGHVNVMIRIGGYAKMENSLIIVLGTFVLIFIYFIIMGCIEISTFRKRRKKLQDDIDKILDSLK